MSSTLHGQFHEGIGKKIVPWLALLLFIQAGATFIWRSPSAVVLPLVITSLIVLGTGLLGDESGRLDIRQPWSILLVVNVPFWVIGSWEFALDETNWSDLIIAAQGQISRALLLVSLAFVLIAIGYRLGISFASATKWDVKTRDWEGSKLIFATVVIYLICWATRIHWYRTVLVQPFFDLLGREPDSTFIRLAVGRVPTFLLLCAWTFAYQHHSNRGFISICVAMTLCEIAWGFLYGVMKRPILEPLFVPVLPYVIMHNKIPWRRIALVAILLIGIAYPYVNTVRESYFQPNGPRRPDAIRNALTDGLGLFAPKAEKLVDYSQMALSRVSGLGSVCQALQMGADGTLDLHGAFYWRALEGLIPRFLWKNKPIIEEGAYFNAYLHGQRGLESVDLSKTTTSTATTLFGSFYWNLGWWGVVVSSLALGTFSGVAYRWVKSRQLGCPSTLLYYVALLNCLNTPETSVGTFPSSLILGMGLVWVANWALEKGPLPAHAKRGQSRPRSTAPESFAKPLKSHRTGSHAIDGTPQGAATIAAPAREAK